jgi:hypothetical protein
MREKREVWEGTLALMVLQSLEVLGPQHGGPATSSRSSFA